MITTKMLLRLFTAVAVLLLTACASTGPIEEQDTVFYPALPQQPRLQFLATISSEDDLRRAAAVRGSRGLRDRRELGRPVSVAHELDRLYLVDRAHQAIIIVDLAAGTFEVFPQRRLGKLSDPMAITVADGFKYVADPGRGQVVVFDENNDYVRAYGTLGQYHVIDVAVHGNRLYLVENKANQIVVLDRESGELVRIIGSEDPEQRLRWLPGNFDRPTHITVDHQGNLLVVDAINSRVQIFDADGKFTKMIGDNYVGPGGMPRPKGLAVDREGRFYLADSSMELVQIFDIASEDPLLAFGKGPPVYGATSLTHAVHIDFDNLERFAHLADRDFRPLFLIYVTSFGGPNKLNVYAFGEWVGPPL
jgi:hypothetical protein